MSSTQTLSAVSLTGQGLSIDAQYPRGEMDRPGRQSLREHEGISLRNLTSNRDRSPHDHQTADHEWDTEQGWPAVAAGSAIFFVYLGLIYSYGIVQLHLDEANLASLSTLSFIGSLGAAMGPLTGMIVARVIRCIGYRATALVGSVLLGLGEFTAGFSTKSVPAMFITQGLLFGVGASCLFLVREP